MSDLLPSTRVDELSLLSPNSKTTENPAPLKYTKVWQRARQKLSLTYRLSKFSNNSELAQKSETISATSLPALMIIPDSKFKLVWNALLFTTLLYSALINPFTIAFNDSTTLDAWEIIDLVIDAFFFFDVLVNLNSAYYDSSSNLITNRKKIILTYLKSWFIIDLLSCVPFSLIGILTQSESNQTNKFVRFVRLPRLYKLLRMSRLLKILNGTTKSEVFIKLQDFLSIRQSVTRFCSSIATILMAVHIIACMWYYSAKLDEFNPDTWVVRGEFIDADVGTLYITSIYWAFTTLSTVGYGDICPFTIPEKVIAVTWMIAGLYFLAFTIGSLSSMAASIDTKEKILSRKIAAIDEFITETQLSKKLAHKLRHSLKHSSQISGFSWADKQNILNELPKNLQYEISMAMHRGAARHISFFVDKKNSLISSIVPFLTPVAIMANDYIYKQDDFADEIYFLVKGTVDYFYKEVYCISTINTSDYFGDIEVIFQIPRKYSAKARRKIELLSMGRTVLSNLKKEYFCVWEELKTEAIERDRRNKLNQSRLVRKTTRFMTKALGHSEKKNAIPTIQDLSEQIGFLFDIAEKFHNKLEKMQKKVRPKKRMGKYYSDDEH